LIFHYQNIDYKIPDLTKKTDIFASNPLLEENKNRVIDYYKKMGSKLDYKHLAYIQNMNTATGLERGKIRGVYDKTVNSLELDENIQGSRNDYLRLKQDEKSIKLEEQNKKLKVYNMKMRHFINEIKEKKNNKNINSNNKYISRNKNQSSDYCHLTSKKLHEFESAKSYENQFQSYNKSLNDTITEFSKEAHSTFYNTNTDNKNPSLFKFSRESSKESKENVIDSHLNTETSFCKINSILKSTGSDFNKDKDKDNKEIIIVNNLLSPSKKITNKVLKVLIESKREGSPNSLFKSKSKSFISPKTSPLHSSFHTSNRFMNTNNLNNLSVRIYLPFLFFIFIFI